jgi:hypothetical protein
MALGGQLENPHAEIGSPVGLSDDDATRNTTYLFCIK